jgi:hypothetical protein
MWALRPRDECPPSCTELWQRYLIQIVVINHKLIIDNTFLPFARGRTFLTHCFQFLPASATQLLRLPMASPSGRLCAAEKFPT